MKLSQFAKKYGVSYKTAWRWFQNNTLPAGVKMEQLASGTVVVTELAPSVSGGVALYARVSSFDQKKDLESQLGRLVAYASEHGLNVSKAVTEVGSGLNGHRPRLMKLLSDSDVSAVVVEHRDRLMRFGAEYVESALAASGRKLIVVDPGEVKDDLVQDMIEVLTSFCARLYGRRSAKHKAQKALEFIHE
ncbi:MAG: IS607 family transposase [Geobacter sp.]|nr:IS607 family transposase [Geobacter sp.]